MSEFSERIVKQTEALLHFQHDETLQETTPERLHEALGQVIMMEISDNWTKTKRRQAPGRRAFRCRKHPATGNRNEKARLVKRRAFVRSCERGKLVLMGRAVFAGHGGDVDADDAHVAENGLRGGTRTGSAVALRDGVQRLAFFGDIFNDGGPARAADGLVVGGGFLPGDFHVGGDAEPDPSVAGDQFHLCALGGRMEIELAVKVHEIDRDDIGMLFRGDGQEQGFGLRK